MKFFGLEGPASWRGALINISDTKGRLSSYLIWDEGGDKLFRFSTPRAVADVSIGLGNLVATDCLPTNIGVPIFSPRLRDAFIQKFPNEAAFYECTVVCDRNESTYFLCKVKSYLPLIDEQTSSFRVLEEGEQILLQAAYRDDPEADFLLARDWKFRERLVVSQKFVDFCRDHGFRVSFGKPV